MKHSFITTVSSNGQFTVPKQLRAHLGLTRGDRLVLDVDAEAGGIAFRFLPRNIVAETADSLAGYVRRCR